MEYVYTSREEMDELQNIIGGATETTPMADAFHELRSTN